LIEIGIDPVVNLGPISIRWYGILVALAVITVVGWAVVEVNRKRLPVDTAFTAALVGIPSGIVVSRLLHVIDDWSYYFQNPGQIIGGSGLTAWGAVLGAALGIWIYSRVSKFNFGHFADLIAPGIILAQAVGRIGCTINGCCYGKETHLPWAVVYSHPDSFGPLGIPVHPTQVYELVYNLIVFGVLFKLRGRFQPDGSLFLIYLSLYSLWRLGSDFLRAGTPFLSNPLGLHQAQVIAIIILLVTIPYLVLKTRPLKPVSEVEKNETSL
jgi:phosphatidylglycerol:prolipoprotein diacylglycerol transferase